MGVLAAYNLLKFILAFGILEELAVNPWGFLFWDLITIPPYVMGMGNLVRSLGGGRAGILKTAGWGILLIAAFLAPYLYLAVCGGGSFTGAAKGALALIVLLMLVNLARDIRRRSEK